MTKKQQLQNNNSLELSDDFKRQAIEKIYQGKPLTGRDGIFSGMIKDILETALNEELNQHLASEKQSSSNAGNDFSNRKNGHNSKTLKTRESSFILDAPRDRNSSFDPQIVKKNQTVLTEELDNKIIALYGLGMSYCDISSHIEEIYGIEISKSSLWWPKVRVKQNFNIFRTSLRNNFSETFDLFSF